VGRLVTRDRVLRETIRDSSSSVNSTELPRSDFAPIAPRVVLLECAAADFWSEWRSFLDRFLVGSIEIVELRYIDFKLLEKVVKQFELGCGECDHFLEN
jgi:hypothetical protein